MFRFRKQLIEMLPRSMILCKYFLGDTRKFNLDIALSYLVLGHTLGQADSEAEDSEMTEKLQSNEGEEEGNDQSNDLSQSEDEHEPMESDNTKDVKLRQSPSLDALNVKDTAIGGLENGHISPMSPSLMEVLKKCNFPSDILTLRKVEESLCYQTGLLWTVSLAIPLPKGSSIGPYTGKMVALGDLKEREHILQAGEKFAFVEITDDSGVWLSLLRPTDKSSPHNACVYFEGDRIWCETVEDLAVGTELVASFTTGTKQPITDKSDHLLKREPVEDSARENGHKTTTSTEAKPLPQLPPQHALIFGCPFCGVRFSSPRTLDAHLTFYCSKKPPAHSDRESKTESDRGSTSPSSDMEPSRSSMKRPHEDGVSDSASSHSDTDAPSSKSPKSGQSFKCGSCDYAADRLSSLNRHKRIHSRGSESSMSSERLSVSPICQSETFCKDCNIQFSSMSTYRGHREFYCKFRRQEKSEDNVSVGSSPPNKDKLSPNLVSPPILLPKGLIQAGAIPHPLHFARSPLLMQAIPKELQALLAHHKEQDLPHASAVSHALMKASTDELKQADDQPLDLSTSKSKSLTESNDEHKTKASSPVLHKAEQRITPEHSPDSNQHLSPGLQRQDIHGDTGKVIGPPGKATLKVPMFPAAQVTYVKNKPIPPMQMVSRCVECNIVFYKHENYLIHKEHYCSGRRGGVSMAGEDNHRMEQEMIESPSKSQISPGQKSAPPEVTKSRDNISPSSPKLPKGNISPGQLKPNELCYLFYCIPCNIKFSSSGTLKAHKEFYCPHGKDNDTSCVVKEADADSDRTSSDNSDLYRCDMCHSEYTSARHLKLHFCTGLAAQAPLLRCPYCEYVTQTENRLSEHMKVHVPTKAFKCTLCGYRGNTARGMRMHGKMHLENGEEFTDDNMLEFEEPPLVPVQRNGVCDKGPVDIETELIRMKNEPYKRRRSRKSFEKSENMPSFLGAGLLPQNLLCAACGQAFNSISEFVIHLRMHEMAALEAMKNLKSLKCEHCDNYIADSLTGLLFHMQERHPEQLPNTSRSANQSESEGERSQSRDSHRSLSLEDRSRSNSEESSIAHTSNSSHRDDVKPKIDVNKADTGDQLDITNNDERILQVKQEQRETGSSEDEESGVKESHESNDNTSARTPNSERSKSPNSSMSPVTSVTGKSNDVNPSSVISANGISKSISSPPPLRSIPEVNPMLKLSSDSASPNKGHTWHIPHTADTMPQLSPGSRSDDENTTNQIGPVSPAREPVMFSKHVPSMPISALQKSPISPHQNNLSPWKQISPKLPTVKSEPASPLQRENHRDSPYSIQIQKERETSLDLEKSPNSHRPSNPSTPTTPSQFMLQRNILSPHLQNLPLLYSPQALMQLYQLQHSFPTPSVSLPGGTANSSESSTEENSSRKYCKHCDINFTYLSSFLTHKKYYCSARASSEELSPSPSA